MLVSLARFLQTPVILFGVHLGRPPVSQHGRDLMGFTLDNADLITTREDTIVDRLRALTDTTIVGGADSGFSVDLGPLTPSEDLRHFQKGSIAGQPYALVTLRSMYWAWGLEKREAFAAVCASAIDRMLVRKGLAVVMHPHCTYDLDHPWEDDRAMHRLIRSKSGHPERYLGFEGDASVSDTLHLYDEAKFVLSNRRHAGIFAALKGVPFLVFGERAHIGPIHHLLADESQPFIDYEGLSADALGRSIAGASENRIPEARSRAFREREKSELCLGRLADFVLEL